MGVWRPKQEESKTIWFRVPASLKKEFEDLRQQAEAEGLDAAATFTAALGAVGQTAARGIAPDENSADGGRREGKGQRP